MQTISIIVPVYNVEKYLKRCLESIVNQTYSNLQIILINDGSTDKSADICNEFAKRDNRIDLFHIKNQGVSHARNLGLSKATGEYIGFIDSDDFIEKDMFEILINNANQYNCEISACGSKTIYLNGKIDFNKNNGELRIYNKNEAALEVMKKLDGALWNKIYKRDLIKELSFKEGRTHGEDLYFQFQCLAKCSKMVYKYDCKHNYLKREESITTSSFSIKSFDQIYFKDLIYELIVKEFPELESDAVRLCYLSRLNICRKILISDNRKKYNNLLKEYKNYLKEKYSQNCKKLKSKEKLEYFILINCEGLYPYIMRKILR